MKKINLNFRRYTDGGLLVLAQAIALALNGNVYFPTIAPPIATLQTAIGDYTAALAAAAQGGKNNIAVKNARKADLIAVLVSIALDIMKQAEGDLVKLTSTAFPLSKDKTPIGPLGEPQILKLEDGAASGSLMVTVSKVTGAKTYGYEYTLDPLTEASQWNSEIDSVVKHTFNDLESGKKYWVRVVAYGNNEQESDSDPVSRIVQ
jgi:hypothetical protein